MTIITVDDNQVFTSNARATACGRPYVTHSYDLDVIADLLAIGQVKVYEHDTDSYLDALELLEKHGYGDVAPTTVNSYFAHAMMTLRNLEHEWAVKVENKRVVITVTVGGDIVRTYYAIGQKAFYNAAQGILRTFEDGQEIDFTPVWEALDTLLGEYYGVVTEHDFVANEERGIIYLPGRTNDASFYIVASILGQHGIACNIRNSSVSFELDFIDMDTL